MKIDSFKLETEIKDLIAKIIERDKEEIGLDVNLVEDLGMDSMMGLEIIAHLENKYQIEVEEERLPKVATLRNILNLVLGLVSKNA